MATLGLVLTIVQAVFLIGGLANSTGGQGSVCSLLDKSACDKNDRCMWHSLNDPTN
jgi:hypothetical protein